MVHQTHTPHKNRNSENKCDKCEECTGTNTEDCAKIISDHQCYINPELFCFPYHIIQNIYVINRDQTFPSRSSCFFVNFPICYESKNCDRNSDQADHPKISPKESSKNHFTLIIHMSILSLPSVWQISFLICNIFLIMSKKFSYKNQPAFLKNDILKMK